MAEKITRLYQQGSWQKWVLPFIVVVTCITCLQLVNQYNNNITIFRYSSLHLLAHQPLYTAYPQAYQDYFLYHPSFPVLFMPFAFLPPAAALCTWTLLSTVLFVRSVYLLPGITAPAKKIMLLLALPELANNQQYVQTNILLAALMLFSFVYFERGKMFWAAFFTVMAFCIKGYGGITGLLFLLYPNKIKFIGYGIVWGIIIAALPLLFVSFSETITLYKDWLQMISSDEIKESLSLIGVFGQSHKAELLITLVGLLLLFAVFAVSLLYPGRKDSMPYRALLCCYLFIWVVLFNRAAESPTYQLAVTAMGYWLAINHFKRWQCYFTAAVFIAVYVIPSDLFPAIFHGIFNRYNLKVYPFAVFFFLLQTQLWKNTFNKKQV